MGASPIRTQIEPGIWLDSRRALWLESSRSLVVADLHWGYAAAHRAAGNLLPMWGDDVLTKTLEGLLADYAPAEMIWLGDVIHARAGREVARSFAARARATSTIVVRGNHDRAWPGTEAVTELTRAGFLLHHGHEPLRVQPGQRELVGHFHPALVWNDGAGTRLRLPALVTGPGRWILPAFSPWAAGVSWLGQLGSDELLWAIAPGRIFAVTSEGLPALRPKP